MQKIDVKGFILKNFKPYRGDESFLTPATQRTKKLFEKVNALFEKEKEKNGVLDINTGTVSSLLNYPAGYIDKENEIIVGIQTDKPLKRGVNPFGGIRMARSACEAYGYKLSQEVENHFLYRTTHNDGVFRVYNEEMKTARKCGVITGLPDAYGRGRIIGDYRRAPLYGVDFLIEQKEKDKRELSSKNLDAEKIRLCEELYSQINFLQKLKDMAKLYGYDISLPAKNGKEAVQWLYFAYLAAIKEQNGAAMSLGRVSAFLDIYFEKDLKNKTFTESEIQEIIDDFVIKLRIARHLRTPDYNELFGGDPMWITECVGGMAENGVPLVTKTSYRFINTLYNLCPAPEPNITVLWSEKLPENFKKYCAKTSIETDALQYENDDLMRPLYGCDYAIACCVSAMKVGKQMQYFGARCNLPKLFLLSLNGGKDELSGAQVAPPDKVFSGKLDYAEVIKSFKKYLKWLAGLYVNTMNVIHYMHDKYAYEKTQMALHDTNVERFMAFGIAGLSVVADSLSAIKYAEVTPVLNSGIITGFDVKGKFPKFGNDDDRVDGIARELVKLFYENLKKTPAYRNAIHTLSVLTITSNVVYGKKTGATPDGRKAGESFAPGANPMHMRERCGALSSLNSVAKLPYDCCRDGISNTFSIIPETLGGDINSQVDNLISVLDGYFSKKAHHLNVNVINRDKLIAAYEKPELYPNLTIRVSGYAVNFVKLSKEQQREVIARTFHENY